MSHTYYQQFYHLIWSTKDRKPLILESHQNRIYTYLGGVFRSLKCYPIQIGGMTDHVHALVIIPPTVLVVEAIRNVKVSTSKWISQNFSEIQEFSWQEGYGSFTVSSSHKEMVTNYIQNQKIHHQKYDFKTEFIKILKKYEISFDEKYLWK